MASEAVVRICYCPRCNWLSRAAWVAQELLQTFPDELAGVLLEPAEAGTFRILIGNETLWDRRDDGPVPDVQILKCAVRDRICPERSLGHLDRKQGGVA